MATSIRQRRFHHADGFPAPRTKLEELLCIEGVPPPQIPAPTSTPLVSDEDLLALYSNVYAPAIDKFLETTWFVSRGPQALLADRRLCEQLAFLASRFHINPNVPQNRYFTTQTRSLDTSAIWSMMNLCRQESNAISTSANGETDDLDANDGVKAAVQRLGIFEDLISGHYRDSAPPPQRDTTRNGTAFNDQLKFREREFWRLVEKFLSIRDDEASSAKEIDDTLSECRSTLDSRENRDVIYSIAIVRHIGQRVAEFPEVSPPEINDEQDVQAKLWVAKKFVEDEASGKGTTPVVQKLCLMAVRSWTTLKR